MLLNQKISRRKLLECSVALGLVLAVVLSCGFSDFYTICGELRQNTLRLHVQANSDSEADQALKLKVRDAVLETAGPLFSQQQSKEDAVSIAQENLEQIQQAAEAVVAREGSDQAVKVYLTNMYFDTTHYETFTLPAGRYDALRVELGRKEGHNWFCVLYPGLCLPAAKKAEGEQAHYADEKQQKILENSNQYEIRFAVVEAAEHFTRWLKSL